MSSAKVVFWAGGTFRLLLQCMYERSVGALRETLTGPVERQGMDLRIPID